MSLEKKPWIKQFLGRTNNSDVYWKNKAFELNYNAEPTFESQASKHKVWPEKRVRFYKKKKKKGLKWQNCKEIILVTSIIGSDQKVAGFVFLC